MWWLALTGAKKVSKWGYKEYRKKHNNDNNNPTSINMANLPYPPPPAAPEPEVSTRARLKAQLEIGVYFLQVVFGLTVVGLYARERMNGMNAKWVYAFLTGLVAAGTAVLYLGYGVWVVKTGRVGRERGGRGCLVRLVWGGVVVVLWLVVFGVFGGVFIGVYGVGGEDEVRRTRRMRHAVWVDLVNLVLWVGGVVWEGLRWWRVRGKNVQVETVEKDVSPA